MPMHGIGIEEYLLKSQTHSSLHAADPSEELHGITDTWNSHMLARCLVKLITEVELN